MKTAIPQQRELLIELFLDRNSKINLSAIRDSESVRLKHIVDSLQGIEQFGSLFTNDTTVLDIGTGGGFPLLPLAIAAPQSSFTGLDARKKKITAVQAMIDTLEITNCSTVWARVEDHKRSYSLITARAVTYADQLLERSLPRLRRGGHLLLWKMFTFEEDAEIRELIYRFDLELIDTFRYTLPNDTVPRAIYLIKK